MTKTLQLDVFSVKTFFRIKIKVFISRIKNGIV